MTHASNVELASAPDDPDDVVNGIAPPIRPSASSSLSAEEFAATHAQADDDYATSGAASTFSAASWLSKASMWFFFDLIKLHASRGNSLNLEDIPRAAPEDRADLLGASLLKRIAKDGGVKHWTHLGRIILSELPSAGFHWVSFTSILFVARQPIFVFVLQKLLQSIQTCSSDQCDQLGSIIGYCFALFFLELARRFQYAADWFFIMRSWMRINTALRSAVFQKALTLPAIPRGRANNILMVDPRTIGRSIRFLYRPIVNALEILVTFASLWRFLGLYPSLAAASAFLIIVPLNYYGIRKLDHISVRMSAINDKRIARISEILANMQTIKLFSWEHIFRHKINQIRAKELTYVREFQNAVALLMFMILSVGSLVSLLAFGVYSTQDNSPFTADVIFPSLMLLGSLYWPMLILPEVISNFVEFRTAARRLTCFFNEKPVRALTDAQLGAPKHDAENLVVFDRATFAWPPEAPLYPTDEDGDLDDFSKAGDSSKGVVESSSGDLELVEERPSKDELHRRFVALLAERRATDARRVAEPVLRDISLRVPRGSLVAVVGLVGSGKSALVHAVLGELELRRGTLERNAYSLSYVPQRAWIRNGTVRDNVLLGRAFDAARWRSVIEACALEADLRQLRGGEFCEIGEKGVTLSGGQKQRVSLARAAYAPGDLLLLDDPLSAVDAHVGRHIFDNLLSRRSGLLRECTCVLVTHQLQFLPRCDLVVVMEAGSIRNVGTHEELRQRGVNFAELVDLSQSASDAVKPPSSASLPLLDETELESSESSSLAAAAGGGPELVDLRFDDGDTDSTFSAKVDAAMSSPSGPLSPLSPRRTSSQGAAWRRRVIGLSTDSAFDSADVDPFPSLPPVTPTAAPAAAAQPLRKLRVTTEGFMSPASPGSATPALSMSIDMSEIVAEAGDGDEAAKRREGQLVAEEEQELGGVARSTYVNFMWIVTGGRWQLALLVVSLILMRVANNGSAMWLGHWTSAPDSTEHVWFYLGVFVGLGVTYAAVTLVRSFFWARQTVLGSRQLHATLLDSVMAAPMSFFFATPVGRIVARFSSDLSEVDRWLPDMINDSLYIMSTVVASLLLMLIYCPWLFVVLVPFLVYVRRIERQYRGAAVDIGRLYTKTNSPLFSHFEETLHGGSAIRAGSFGRTLVREHHLLAHANVKTEFYQTIAVRWLDLRVSMSATLTSFFTTLLLCVAIATDWPGVSKTMVGFVIVTVFDCTDALGWAIMCVSNVERAMSRIERVFQYSSITPEERAVYLDVPRGAPTMAAQLLRTGALRAAAGAAHGGLTMDKPTSEKDLSLEDGIGGGGGGGGKLSAAFVGEFFARRALAHPVDPPANWPTTGELEFRNLSLRYRADTPLALDGLSFTIPGGKKVGVVGRTGAGKSSLTTALFRLVEPCGGGIFVDGVNLLDISLRRLRDSVSIVPQEAMLFEGTIRENLDVADQFDDARLWQALEQMQLAPFVRAQPRQLLAPLTAQSLSVGQRQLLCLARALLRDTRVVVLDESTANCDTVSDNMIQRAIRTHFAGRTLLTIAHRLSTILDYDLILVMGNGTVKELGPPKELIARGGEFASLVAAHRAQLRQNATTSHD
jgi:ABC-type multidrug transport system fused ATPase/permease subunit